MTSLAFCFVSLLFKTSRFQAAGRCVCSVIDHRRRQNVVRTSVTHLAIASCVTVIFVLTTFWRHLWTLLHRCTATWNPFVKFVLTGCFQSNWFHFFLEPPWSKLPVYYSASFLLPCYWSSLFSVIPRWRRSRDDIRGALRLGWIRSMWTRFPKHQDISTNGWCYFPELSASDHYGA